MRADAPTFANLPGLLAKIWLRDPESNTYGGLYLWDDQEAYERYIKGEVFKCDQGRPEPEERRVPRFWRLRGSVLTHYAEATRRVSRGGG